MTPAYQLGLYVGLIVGLVIGAAWTLAAVKWVRVGMSEDWDNMTGADWL